MGYKFNPFTGNLDTINGPAGTFTDVDLSGDLTLGSGIPTTTLQAITPTANRTISFPDATGTVALVSGSNGTVQYNEGGVLKGNSDFTVDPDWNDAAVTFTGLKLNVTDTASAASSNLLDLQVNGTSRVVATATGNVGIGTTSPGDKLHVDGGALRIQNGTGVSYAILAGRTTDGRSEFAFRNNAGSSDLARIVGQTSALSIDVAGSERARIDSSGRLLVGTSSSTNNPRLGVAGSIHAGGGPNTITLAAAATGTIITPARGYSYVNISASNGTTRGLLLLLFASTTTLSIVSTIDDRSSGEYSASVSGRDLQITNATGLVITYSASCMTLAWGDNG